MVPQAVVVVAGEAVAKVDGVLITGLHTLSEMGSG